MKVASFFAGCGGLDLGFRQAGFQVIWANEYDKTIHPTYRLNHPDTFLNTTDIRQLNIEDIPDCDGFIGGPPCQSWSLGGKMKGLEDERGKLFLNYIHIIKNKKPKFFVIENVAGIISDQHFKTFHSFISMLANAGYCVKFSVLNAADYKIPQIRLRVFIVGIRQDLSLEFSFPEPLTEKNDYIPLQRAIGDITETPRFYDSDPVSQNYGSLWNHDCYSGPYDKKYMSRNRLRKWDETSFTIQAQARNAPLHPQAPPMIYVSQSDRRFNPEYIQLYRRLSVRECARIQSFPDSFHFIYSNIQDGYKMVGNAVPPRLAKYLGIALAQQLSNATTTKTQQKHSILVGYYRDNEQLRLTKKNKLYYVRTGFRPGAMQIPPGQNSPEYLILHKGEHWETFSLQPHPPAIKSKEELTSLGFHPHGDVYLCFAIKEALPPSSIKMENAIKKTTSPYIAFI